MAGARRTRKSSTERRRRGNDHHAGGSRNMSSLSESFRSQNEAIHGELFILHDDIYRRALKRIKDALLILHKIEDHQDIRKQVRGYVTEFEALREDLERIGRTAAD